MVLKTITYELLVRSLSFGQIDYKRNFFFCFTKCCTQNDHTGIMTHILQRNWKLGYCRPWEKFLAAMEDAIYECVFENSVPQVYYFRFTARVKWALPINYWTFSSQYLNIDLEIKFLHFPLFLTIYLCKLYFHSAQSINANKKWNEKEFTFQTIR